MSTRLNVLIDEVTKGSRRKFAEKAGINQTTLNNYTNGRIPKADALEKICKSYKISLNWLVAGIGPKYINPHEKEEDGQALITKPSEYDKSEIEYIPMTEAALSAGGGAFTDSESMRDYYAFKKDWLMRTVTAVKNAVLVGVIGTSMEPTIYNGDVVMLDFGRTHINEGNMYALRLDDTVMVKRLSLRPNDKIKVISDNKTEYESYTADCGDVHIIGQIVWFARSLVRQDTCCSNHKIISE